MTFDNVLLSPRPETPNGTGSRGILGSFLTAIGLLDNKRHHRQSLSASSIWSFASSIFVDDVLRLKAWDEGLIQQSLVLHNISPRALTEQEKHDALGDIVPRTAPNNRLPVGTFHGTSRALTSVFGLIESRFNAYFDATNLQPSLPQGITDLKVKRDLYQWSPGVKAGADYDTYPPHLSLIPRGSGDYFTQGQLFDRMRLLDTGFILSSVVPDTIKDFVNGNPDDGNSMAAIEDRNYHLRAVKKNIYSEPNIGDRKDWFTDEVFAQQCFTGNNPSTIELAREWTGKFKAIARNQNNLPVLELLTATSAGSLFVQDFTYLREAVGVTPESELWVKGKTEGENRYACASVALFRLEPKGQLHPVAICIDFKGSLEKSVTLFNRRLQTTDSVDQATDWPWRYAKTCLQSSDWIRHECIAHLNDTHFIEEAVIVAAYRNLPETHPVYRILHPHWLKTLSINAGARSMLVPHVITQIIGVPVEHCYSLLTDAYKRFNFTQRYVPNDLEKRGFPVQELDDKKFHNYAYARDVYLMWTVIREYVRGFLCNNSKARRYDSDESVVNDLEIQAWWKEMRADDGAQMATFPEITTLDALIDAVTMCIHIASPQHTAVNYLQEYYQSFVPNKPPALCSRLPTSLEQLRMFTEKDLLAALPVNRGREWLLASHIPHLLSYRVAEEQNLINYAVSQYHLADNIGDEGIKEAARKFAMELRGLGNSVNELGRTVKGYFSKISDELDDQTMPYMVMEPSATAVSILI